MVREDDPVFDTHAIARSSAAAGMNSAHVEALTDALRQAAEHERAEYATRTDIATLRGDIYRAMLIQAGAIVGAVIGTVRFLG